MPTTSRTDIHDRVTNQIITALEAGTRPWVRPWDSGNAGFPRRSNGEHYRGINTLILWLTAEQKGYSSSYWMTFNAARELKACVKKAEKGTQIIFCQPVVKTDASEDGEEIESRFWITRVYTVFNADQISGLPEQFVGTTANHLDPAQRVQHAEAYFSNTGADIQHGGGSAFYRPSTDHIQMPEFEAFRSPEAYYATLAHECCHWTGAKHRLDRLQKSKGDDYSREEMVAEIGAAFACAELGLEPEIREDHAAYLEHWIKALKGDKKLIFVAAAQAQKAVDFLNGLQPKPDA